MNPTRCMAAACLLAATAATAQDWPRRFDFGTARSGGAVAVTPESTFSEARGHGLDLGFPATAVDRGGEPLAGDFLTAVNGAFFFSVAVPEGNYEITVLLGDPLEASATTVRAEMRRLMVEEAVLPAGSQREVRFTVNVHRPEIAGGGRVALKEREKGLLRWDGKLTLEFGGNRPCVAAVTIAPAPEAVTVHLLGDSTVTDQPYEPWNSWGQMLPRFFQPGVAVENHAESGETLRNSLGARRVAKMESRLRAGDFVLVQFGHNDMKDKRPDALETFRTNLRALVGRVRDQGATPVLVTSMERKSGRDQDTLGPWPQTVRALAAELDAPLVDLHAVSRELYGGLGEHLNAAFQDGTHHNNFGSYLLARCVAESLREAVPQLGKRLAADLPDFDPARPPQPGDFRLAPSALTAPHVPDGS